MTPRFIQEGPRTASVVIVGEAPGKKEIQFSRPFIGGSGDILNRTLSQAGIDRGDVFLTNLCHVQPPGNSFSWFHKKANRAHYELGVTKLVMDLMEIKPKVVVALGDEPLYALTQRRGISKWRGSILPCSLIPGIKVIPTYHPAYALRDYPAKSIIAFDLKRVVEELAIPGLSYPQRTLYLPDGITRRNGEAWIHDHTAQYDREAIAREMLASDWLSPDIECWERADGSWEIACIGFSDIHSRSLVLDWRVPEQRRLATMLVESDVPKIYQNGTFDTTVMMDNGLKPRNFAWDTMLAHHTLHLESASGDDEMAQLSKNKRKRTSPFRKGLAFINSLNTREPFYKDDGKLWKNTGDINIFWRYNGLDCGVTRESRDKQDIQLQRRNLYPAFLHRMELVEPLMMMTATGVKIDLTLRQQLRERYEREIDETTARITAQVGNINVKSSKQAQELFYGKLGLPIQYKHDKKKGTSRPTADKYAIAALAEKYDNPVLRDITYVRERRDFIERYLTASVDVDGRMRCAFDITGTNSCRLSSRQSIYGSGTNLQNIPARRADGRLIRRMFVADDGKVLLYLDYSQAEARIVAYLARCLSLIELFNDPTRDIHSENAARIFNLALEQILKDSLERFLAKQGIHAGNYGQGPKDMARRINAEADYTGIRVTDQQCGQIQQRIFALYPEIQENFWRDVERELKRTRALRGLFGDEREFHGRWDDHLIRSAYAFKPQNAVGVLCCKALISTYRRIQLGRPDLGVQLLLNVHDALLLQCNREHVEEVAALTTDCMNIPVPVNGEQVFIPTDVKVGNNWDIYSADNPNGLRDLKKWISAA